MSVRRVVGGLRFYLLEEGGPAGPPAARAPGRLLARGHWIACGYFGAGNGALTDADGYFDTGDIATIDPDGYMMITDRAKDVIKSGGEWISSIDLENAAMDHPAVAEAAVIGVAHPTWQERPLLIVVRKPGQQVDAAALQAHLATRVARWWCPDAVEFVDQLPHTPTGKIQKLQLRAQFRDYQLTPSPSAQPAAAGAAVPTLLIVPGLRGHVPEHWQTLLAEATPGARIVPPLEQDGLSRAARVAALEQALAEIDGPVTLVAHSAGVLTVAHWAISRRAAGHHGRVVGALLVTPPDLAEAWPEPYPSPATMFEHGWAPLPRDPLPFPAMVAASSNDPLASLEAVRAMASGWGAQLVELGPVGHLNPAAGYGPWPLAAELLARLQARA
jgi:predicted alpha/beta hydrolase family esterase